MFDILVALMARYTQYVVVSHTIIKSLDLMISYVKFVMTGCRIVFSCEITLLYIQGETRRRPA